MARYNKKIVERICELIETDSFTIEEISNDVGITRETFYQWKRTKPDFSDAIKKAEQRFKDGLLPEARHSLKKLVRGYTVTETKTVTADTGKKNDDGNPIVKVKEHTKTEKHVQPSLGAVIFALTNTDPDNWKNRQDTNVSADVTLKSELEDLTDEQLDEIIKGDNLETSDTNDKT